MATTRKTITVTDQQDQWIKAQIAAGGFTNDGEYIRELAQTEESLQLCMALSDQGKSLAETL